MNRGIDPVMGDRNATHKMITGSNWSFFMNTFMEMMVEDVVQAIRQDGLRSCYVVSTHRISQSLIKGLFSMFTSYGVIGYGFIYENHTMRFVSVNTRCRCL